MSRPERIAPPELFYNEKCVNATIISFDTFSFGASFASFPKSLRVQLSFVICCREATKYTHNSRIMKIQTEMAVRCIELLNLPEGSTKLLLDVGCGSGLSGGKQ